MDSWQVDLVQWLGVSLGVLLIYRFGRYVGKIEGRAEGIRIGIATAMLAAFGTTERVIETAKKLEAMHKQIHGNNDMEAELDRMLAEAIRTVDKKH